MVFIVMGVSGSGKTAIGKLLAKRMGIKFYDADDYHPRSNIDKMKKSAPLDDEDRYSWLSELAMNIKQWNKKKGAVLACSALRENYRKILSGNGSEQVIFIFLKGDKGVILDRIRKRKYHFFPAGLLETQLDTLEEPPDAITVLIDKTPEEICKEIIEEIGRKSSIN
jgi:carbohydrate kinase (thermoresistant glucokinase family)